MTNGTKVGLWVAGLSVAGLSGYLIFLKLTALKVQRDAELAAQQTTASNTALSPKTITPTVASVAPKTTHGFAVTPAVLKIGTKVFAGSKNANAYKTAQASATNIYKYYPAASYIGTYLGKDGIFSKIIVEESGFFSNSSKTVWVPSADIKY